LKSDFFSRATAAAPRMARRNDRRMQGGRADSLKRKRVPEFGAWTSRNQTPLVVLVFRPR
jgi:hypothetical protein